MESQESIKKVPLPLDEILKKVGEFGRYQKIVDGIFLVSYLFIGFQILLMYFLTLTPSWKCKNNSTSCLFNGTLPGDNMKRCHINRDQWYYTEHKEFSLVTQFNIDCEKKMLLALSSSIHFVGWAVGAIILGYLSDRYGRKKMLFPSATAVLTFGLIISFLPNIYYIIVCRFLVGFFTPGVMIQANILMSEIVGSKHRPLAVLIPFFMFPIGYCVLSLKAYLFKSWKILSIVCTAPYFLSLLFFPLIPESVKWLQMQNRLDEAMDVFRIFAKWNKTELESTVRLNSLEVLATTQNKDANNEKEKSTNFFLITIVQCFIWIISTLSYFGLQLTAKELQGSLYSNFALLSFVHCPAIFASIIGTKKYGRKRTNLLSLLLAGVCCIAIACTPATSKFTTMRVTLGIVGKFFASVCFQGLYIWTIEIFPTHLRSKGVGVIQLASRVGATSAPWVVKELSPLGSWVPFLVLGISSLIGALIGMWLPETKVKTAKRKVTEGYQDKGIDIEL